jgi:hypothetical protein
MDGAYGPIVESTRHPVEKFVSTYGLSLSAKVIITKEHVEAAKRANINTLTLIGFQSSYWDDPSPPTERPLTREEIGARVVRQPHDPPPDQEFS